MRPFRSRSSSPTDPRPPEASRVDLGLHAATPSMQLRCRFRCGSVIGVLAGQDDDTRHDATGAAKGILILSRVHRFHLPAGKSNGHGQEWIRRARSAGEKPKMEPRVSITCTKRSSLQTRSRGQQNGRCASSSKESAAYRTSGTARRNDDAHDPTSEYTGDQCGTTPSRANETVLSRSLGASGQFVFAVTKTCPIYPLIGPA